MIANIIIMTTTFFFFGPLVEPLDNHDNNKCQLHIEATIYHHIMLCLSPLEVKSGISQRKKKEFRTYDLPYKRYYLYH
jgi:hypothetical protein